MARATWDGNDILDVLGELEKPAKWLPPDAVATIAKSAAKQESLSAARLDARERVREAEQLALALDGAREACLTARAALIGAGAALSGTSPAIGPNAAAAVALVDCYTELMNFGERLCALLLDENAA